MLKGYFIYAEDDRDALLLARVALRKIGSDLTMVHCPEGDTLVGCVRDAISSGALPCFILLDLRMPRMDGFEALRWIKKLPELASVPVVIFSSSSLDVDLELAASLGATDYIVKPGTFEKLLEILRALLVRFCVAGSQS